MRKFPRPSHTPLIKYEGSLSVIFIVLCIFFPLFALLFLPIFLFIDSTIGEKEFDNLIQLILDKYAIKFIMMVSPIIVLITFAQGDIAETLKEEESEGFWIFCLITIIDVIYVIVKLCIRANANPSSKEDICLKDKNDYDIKK